MVSSHPAALRPLVSIVLRLLVLLVPFLALVAAQAPGLRWQIDRSALLREIAEERREQRRLREEIARRAQPARLRAEAARLGLVPSDQAEDRPPSVRVAEEPEVHDER
jgi:hypothetical protein